MKFSTMVSTLFCFAFFLATVFALEPLIGDDHDHHGHMRQFLVGKGSVYRVGDVIDLYTNDMDDLDDDEAITIDLYSTNSMMPINIDRLALIHDRDTFVYSWKIPSDIKPGSYYIRISSLTDYDYDDDDVVTSFTFTIVGNKSGRKNNRRRISN
ncbi:hypothetical protein BDB01DRAFT_24862 [Pilobolus umbonatus]|nr:hypothetical protein BDB01DRAFT_24862 [Pilobolus umbonatus]